MARKWRKNGKFLEHPFFCLFCPCQARGSFPFSFPFFPHFRLSGRFPFRAGLTRSQPSNCPSFHDPFPNNPISELLSILWWWAPSALPGNPFRNRLSSCSSTCHLCHCRRCRCCCMTDVSTPRARGCIVAYDLSLMGGCCGWLLSRPC